MTTQFAADMGVATAAEGVANRITCQACRRQLVLPERLSRRSSTVRCAYCKTNVEIGKRQPRSVVAIPTVIAPPVASRVPPTPPPLPTAAIEQPTATQPTASAKSAALPWVIVGVLCLLLILGFGLTAVISAVVWSRSTQAEAQSPDALTNLQISDAEQVQTEIDDVHRGNQQLQTEIMQLETDSRTLQNELTQLRQLVL